MKNSSPVLLIGGGNMGSALATCWQRAKLAPIHVVEPDKTKHAALVAKGIVCHLTLAQTPKNCGAIILAIKPQQFSAFAEELKNHATNQTPLIISIMAGIPLAALHQISPSSVRVMPNLPTLIGEGMSVAYATGADADQRALVTQLFDAVGKFAWVENEELLHAATAISGSGPGYVFAFMEAFEIAAVRQGFSTDLARQLVSQTLRGAALLAAQSADSVSALSQKVASPGGTTEAALRVFTERDLKSLVSDAVDAAAKRSRELVG